MSLHFPKKKITLQIYFGRKAAVQGEKNTQQECLSRVSEPHEDAQSPHNFVSI